MASSKTQVIEYLFEKYWNEERGVLTKYVMTLEDVAEAIRACNKKDGLKRSDKNPANFFKDIVRSRNASRHWPKKVADLRYTGEQRTGTGDCFEFVAYTEGQKEPFPDVFRPNEATRRIRLQSVSLPEAAKNLGRRDEAWLIQTLVNLRIVEQHLATESELDVQEVMHLQMNVKLRSTEIDSIYVASLKLSDKEKGVRVQAIITCEAKRPGERILVGQISAQVKAAFSATAAVEAPTADVVIPLAARSLGRDGVQIIEFAPVDRGELDSFVEVEYVQDVAYELVPPVRGI